LAGKFSGQLKVRNVYGIHIRALIIMKIQENTNNCTIIYHKVFTIKAL